MEETKDNKQQALELYRAGALAWREGRRGEALTLYHRSAALDPDGPGQTALEMMTGIMDFYDKSQLNP